MTTLDLCPNGYKQFKISQMNVLTDLKTSNNQILVNTQSNISNVTQFLAT